MRLRQFLQIRPLTPLSSIWWPMRVGLWQCGQITMRIETGTARGNWTFCPFLALLARPLVPPEEMCSLHGGQRIFLGNENDLAGFPAILASQYFHCVAFA